MKPKGWIRLKTSLPFLQHQINGLCTHPGHVSAPQLTGSSHFKTKQTSTTSLAPLYLCFRIMWGQKFAVYAFQTKPHSVPENTAHLWPSIIFKWLKVFWMSRWVKDVHCKILKFRFSKAYLKYYTRTTWRKSCATFFHCSNSSAYTEGTNIYRDLLFHGISKCYVFLCGAEYILEVCRSWKNSVFGSTEPWDYQLGIFWY